MSYQIPESIYAEFNIVTAQILGRTHYGLERVYKIGKFKIPVVLKVYDGVGDNQRIDSILHGYGKRWHLDEKVIKSAIRHDRNRRIDRYIEKHVK